MDSVCRLLNMVAEIDKNKEVGLCRPVSSSCEGFILADLSNPSHAQQKPNLPKPSQTQTNPFQELLLQE